MVTLRDSEAGRACMGWCGSILPTEEVRGGQDSSCLKLGPTNFSEASDEHAPPEPGTLGMSQETSERACSGVPLRWSPTAVNGAGCSESVDGVVSWQAAQSI